MVENKRRLGMYILLYYVTCGIYGLYFTYQLIKDMNIVCNGDGDETPDLLTFILFSLITCGIYAFYWYYKIAERQHRNAQRYNVIIDETGTTVLLWFVIGSLILGIGYFIGMYIIIKNMNLLATAYNNLNGGNQNYGANNYYNNAYQYNQANQASEKTAPLNKTVNLICTSGEFAGSVFPVEPNDRILIGRDLSCHIKLSENTPNVSRRHCIVTNENGKLYVTDCSSSYGTFLNNGMKLEPNQKREIGKNGGFWLGNKNICFNVQ